MFDNDGPKFTGLSLTYDLYLYIFLTCMCMYYTTRHYSSTGVLCSTAGIRISQCWWIWLREQRSLFQYKQFINFCNYSWMWLAPFLLSYLPCVIWLELSVMCHLTCVIWYMSFDLCYLVCVIWLVLSGMCHLTWVICHV